MSKIKDKYIRVRTSSKRLNKLNLSAEIREKTMTQVIDELIDSLALLEIGDSSTIPLPNQLKN